MNSSVASLETMADNGDSLDLDGTVSWRALLAETEALLERSGVSENPKTEAKWIIEEVTGTAGAEYLDALDGLATVRGVNHLDALVERRVAGEPIQYVLGHWAFRLLDLMVDQRVLIPRPETEVVAGLAMDELDRVRPQGGGIVVDLGTGSGAIGLSVAAERKPSRVLLTDVSNEALTVARANLAGLGLVARCVEITHGSWFDALPEDLLGHCDVIISNPPYVTTEEVLAPSVSEWEPSSALLAGRDGLDDLRLIVTGAAAWLRPGGALVLEMGTGQTSAVAALAEEHGFITEVHHDYAGHDRAVVARWT